MHANCIHYHGQCMEFIVVIPANNNDNYNYINTGTLLTGVVGVAGVAGSESLLLWRNLIFLAGQYIPD